jgi:hypothetical protein
VSEVVTANVIARRIVTVVYNIACKKYQREHLVEVMGKILGKEVHPRYESSRAGDIRHSLADIGRAKGWATIQITASMMD